LIRRSTRRKDGYSISSGCRIDSFEFGGKFSLWHVRVVEPVVVRISSIDGSADVDVGREVVVSEEHVDVARGEGKNDSEGETEPPINRLPKVGVVSPDVGPDKGRRESGVDGGVANYEYHSDQDTSEYEPIPSLSKRIKVSFCSRHSRIEKTGLTRVLRPLYKLAVKTAETAITVWKEEVESAD